jgi:hypothetical protein
LKAAGIHLPLFKKVCENLGNVSTNNKAESKIKRRIMDILTALQKSFANSKASGVKRLRTYKFKIISKVEFKQIVAGGLSPNLDLCNYTTLSPLRYPVPIPFSDFFGHDLCRSERFTTVYAHSRIQEGTPPPLFLNTPYDLLFY